MATPGSPIQKPKLEIMTSTTIHNFLNGKVVEMTDRLWYTHPEFLRHPVGTRFAVLREMDTCWYNGEIRQVIAILDEVTQ